MNSPCIRCAADGRSCCVGVQIYLTIGDVARIARFRGQEDFTVFALATAEYADGGGDPYWAALVLSPDGFRRVMRTDLLRRCFFLGEAGCSLPVEVRPLLCLLYPYEFDGDGIKGISRDCPVFCLPGRQEVLDRIGMPLSKAEEWHRRLYAEIRSERSAGIPFVKAS